MKYIAKRRELTLATAGFLSDLVLKGAWAASTSALPGSAPGAASGSAPSTDWRVVGRGRFRALGFHVYDAVLRAGHAFVAPSYEAHDLELELTYARALRGSAIAERSITEMRRVGSFGDAEADRWLRWMSRVLPDVQAGDRLTGQYSPRSGIRFLHNGQDIGSNDDVAFARLFVGIWLSPRTSAPELRRQLLALAPS